MRHTLIPAAVLIPAVLALGLAPAAHAAPWCSVPAAEAAAHVSRVTWIRPRLAAGPAPLAHLHVEGTLPHQGTYDQSLVALRELPLMREAALAWRAGAGEAYGDAAERYLDAWVSTYQPNLNPIDETGFDALIDTYAILKDRMPPQRRAAAQALLRRWAQGYIASIATGRNGTFTNNWQSHRVKLVAMMAAVLDDPQLWAQARELFWKQMQANVRPDGEVIDFEERDALHYVVYDLDPLLQAALAARSRGEDWYAAKAPNGASLKAAVAWLEPYASGEKPHQEFVHSTVKFDAERAAAGVPGFTGAFDTKHAGGTFWLASRFEPRYRGLAQRLEPREPSFLALCGQ